MKLSDALSDVPDHLAPQVDDLSIQVLSGRRTARDEARTLAETGVARAISEGIEAEKLGFRRLWNAERYALKDTAVMFGAIAARTSRIAFNTCAVHPGARHPVVNAGMLSTLSAMFGPRFGLGLGRGSVWNNEVGLPVLSFQGLTDHAGILARLLRGESVTYDGPAGSFTDLTLTDAYEGPPPEVWTVHMGGPRACRAAANPAFDGAMLLFLTNPGATRRAVTMMREECERIGRDPATLRICQPVSIAPDADEVETRVQLHVRALVTLQMKGVGEGFCKVNGWDEAILDEIRNHPKLAQLSTLTADEGLERRSETLMEVSRVIPDSWIAEVGSGGSAEECVDLMQRFREAGADEVVLYGPTPTQCRGVIEEWRGRASQQANTERR